MDHEMSTIVLDYPLVKTIQNPMKSYHTETEIKPNKKLSTNEF